MGEPVEPVIRPGDVYTPPEGTVPFSALPRSTGEAWLFGKGPSFERVPWGQVGHPRIAINDAALVTPSVDIGLALDEWARWYRGRAFPGVICSPWARECPEEHFHHWAPFAVIKKVYYVYHSRWASREYLIRAQALYKAGTSLATGLTLAWALGADTVHTWGVDGGFKYGRTWATHEHTAGFNKYDDGIRFAREVLCPILKLNWIQHGQ